MSEIFRKLPLRTILQAIKAVIDVIISSKCPNDDPKTSRPD